MRQRFLSEDDARLIKGMLQRGDRQSDIATYFGVNIGRIAEVSTGVTYAEVPPAADFHLPAPGPYASRDLLVLVQKAERRLWEPGLKQLLGALVDHLA